MHFLAKTTTLAFFLSVFLAGCPNEAWDARSRLHSSDPEVRIGAIKSILELALTTEVSGWQQIQELGLRDSEPKVRVAALEALTEFVAARPNEIVKRSFIGKMVYVDTRLLKSLADDSSPEVRMALASFCASADVLSKHGIEILKQILDDEDDESVRLLARESLAKRLQYGITNNEISEHEANDVGNHTILAPAPRSQGGVPTQ